MSTASTRRTVLLRAAAGLAAVTVLCVALVGCRPEPVSSASPAVSGSATPSPTAATPTPTESAQAAQDITLPTACEQLYSPAMLAALQQQAPLNDPGVTMTSTQNVESLEILTSGIPSIRCSWGTPSDSGLATNVSIVDAAQSAAIAGALAAAGFACESGDDGTVCTFAQTMIDLDDNMVEIGETHVLRSNGWVSTASINFAPEGYTEDIVATLWG